MKTKMKKIVSWIGIIMILIALIPSSVFAATSNWDYVAGSHDPVKSGYLTFKVDPPKSGTYYVDDEETMWIKVTISSDGEKVTWESNFDIEYVYVKGGNKTINSIKYYGKIFNYPSGSSGDSGLEAIHDKDISHITFYYKLVIEEPTEPVTETPTEPVTETPTEPVTETPTEPVTETPTEPVTETPTEPVTETPTEPVTETPTEPVTETPTEPVTETPTEPVTETPTEPVTETPTEPVTETPTEPVTETPTEPATDGPTEPATDGPTEPTTEQPTEPATEAPTNAPDEPNDEEDPNTPNAIVEVPLEVTPLAAPVFDEIVPEEVLPLDVPAALPKTGEIPTSLFFGIGGLLSTLGIYLKKK